MISVLVWVWIMFFIGNTWTFISRKIVKIRHVDVGLLKCSSYRFNPQPIWLKAIVVCRLLSSVWSVCTCSLLSAIVRLFSFDCSATLPKYGTAQNKNGSRSVINGLFFLSAIDTHVLFRLFWPMCSQCRPAGRVPKLHGSDSEWPPLWYKRIIIKNGHRSVIHVFFFTDWLNSGFLFIFFELGTYAHPRS